MELGLQFFRVILFCTGIAVVYYLAIRWCVGYWWRLIRKRELTCALYNRASAAAVFAVVALGSGCMAYGFLVAPDRLTVTRYSIESPKLPAGTRIRIVHLADLHVRKEGPRERKLPGMVRALEPDLILHTGDLFGKRQGVEPVLTSLLDSWNIPQYACRGNLDGMGAFRNVLDRAGVMALDGRPIIQEVNGARLRILGFPSGHEAGMAHVLKDVQDDAFNIVLYHHPEGFPCTWDTATDLMLAGHTHGGQVCLPLYGALITMDRFGKRWESGRFEENGVTLIVSRGIGCEPHVPEVRFWCPPEVVVIDLLGPPM